MSIKKIHPAFLQYFERYSKTQAPFMHRQLEEWSRTKPLANMRVLHHLPLVPNTLLKIACLVASGAEVTVSNPSSFVTAHLEAIACLKKANIRYIEDISTLSSEKFDLYFDCGAELYQALGSPLIGSVELTGSGDHFYRKNQALLDFPVISIDRSQTKQLETIFGTAESASQAIQNLTSINPAEKTWMVFGFGKIGRGLAYFCDKNKTPITIIESSQEARKMAESLGLKAIDSHDKKAIQEALTHTDIVVTATGGKAIIAEYPRAWFNNKILANMGVYDEYGDAFTLSDVLNNKEPINFTLDDPTPIQYIDPEFYVHNIAALLFQEKTLTSGVYDLPAILDQNIIKDWCDFQQVSSENIEKWFIQF